MDYTDFFYGRDRLRLTLLECQLTYTCNIRCAYCFNPHHRRGNNELSTDEWKRTIKEGSEMGAKACVFNGGEPLLHEDSVELISYAYSTGMATAISTNGILLNEELTRRLAPVLNVLQISIHPWRYIDDLRSGVEQFAAHVKAFKRYGGRKAVFNIVLYRGLATKLKDLIEIIAAVGGNDLDAIGIQAANPYGQGFLNSSSIPSVEDCETAFEIITNCRKELGITIGDSVSDYFKVKPNTWGTYGVIINPEGYVMPMIEGADSLSYIFKELEFDNVRNGSLPDIWRTSEVFNRFRGTEWHQEPCRSCRIRDECRGGSRMNAYVLTRDMYKADPFCNLAPDHEKVIRFYQNNELELIGAAS